ncbi:uncharacterized protein LOC132197202 [Neocloeon triangulifer]|uniref:uncharacterized protein LOC132197202 n=1 Tax=Neocloeon triangulifer TaxID=2078957 RepID=UPI00286EF63B|nr:uncharacterized protein LOC132197202 [Neocloeon triangulifer]
MSSQEEEEAPGGTGDTDSEESEGLEPPPRPPPFSISKSWLQEVLGAALAPGRPFEVVHFAAKSGSEPLEGPPPPPGVVGDSALSEVLSLHVQYTAAGPRGQTSSGAVHLVLKLPPRDPVSRFFVSEAQFDLREINFYTQVVPDLLAAGGDTLESNWLPIPHCLHATYRTSPHHSVLVLENLKAEGYRSADFAEGLTLDQAKAALEALARMHSLSLVLKVREGSDLQQRYPFLFKTAAATDSYQQLVERGLPQLARFLQRQADEHPEQEDFTHILEALSALRPRTRSVIASLLAPREPLALITHTDFWCSNLLFRDSDDGRLQCAVLDWQMVAYSHPANDLALLLVSSLDAVPRRQHALELLDWYLASLERLCAPLGVSIDALGYTNQMLHADFKRSQLLALLLCVGSVDVALGDERTERRLLHVLRDLYEEGVLTDVVGQDE